MHEEPGNRLGLSLPRKIVVRLTDRPDMTIDVTVDVKQQHNNMCNMQHALMVNLWQLTCRSYHDINADVLFFSSYDTM